MLRRLIYFVLAVLIVFGALVWLGVLQNPLTSSSGTTAPTTQLTFRLGRNAFGDRVLLTADLHIAFIPQSDAPDQIVVAEKAGPYAGDFAWTLIKTPRGETRLIGEIRTGGRSYRVCEYLNRGSGDGLVKAERMFPVNNEGNRARDPEPMDPTLLGRLYDAIAAEQDSLSKEDGMAGAKRSVSVALSSLAGQAVAMCLNPSAAPFH